MSEHTESGSWGFETRAIHAGQDPDPVTGAVTVPVYQTSTYAQDGVGKDRGFEYSRTGNPTRAALEANVAALEGASFGRAFASGMAAEDAIFRLLSPGDHLIMGNDAYGGTYRLVTKVIAASGVSWSTVDLADTDAVQAAMLPETKLVWAETPSNPMLALVDISALAALTAAHDAWLAVDNTFATPYLQQPLALGADFVVHSATKYLGGHSDVVGGFVATRSAGLDERLGFIQNSAGAVPGPWDCYLVLRGIKTLALRMERHCDNAEILVAMLADHEAVQKVLYPGLATHPGHEIAAAQMRRFGGMVSFVVSGGGDAANRLVEQTEIFTLAESLGAVESLIEVPAAMTHLSVEGSALEVEAGLVRMSVGIESIDDLVRDLERALGSIS